MDDYVVDDDVLEAFGRIIYEQAQADYRHQVYDLDGALREAYTVLEEEEAEDD